jgi:hypothetical protein
VKLLMSFSSQHVCLASWRFVCFLFESTGTNWWPFFLPQQSFSNWIFLTLDSSLSYHDDEKLRFCLVLRWHVILSWTLEGFLPFFSLNWRNTLSRE